MVQPQLQRSYFPVPIAAEQVSFIVAKENGPMAKRKHLTAIFDTETTDLSENSVRRLALQPHVFDFCCFLIDEKGKKVRELDIMCKPGGPIAEESSKITGIKTSDCESLPSFEHFAEDVFSILTEGDEVVAHNLTFDMSVIEFERQRLKLPPLAWPSIRTCTVEATEHIFGYRLKLPDLYQHLFGEQFEQAHKARTDVEALTRCFIELRKRELV